MKLWNITYKGCCHQKYNEFIPITFYDGDFEDGIVVLKDTLYSDQESFRLPNGDISIVADYIGIVNGQKAIIHVVDGDDLDYESDDYCEGVCHEEGEISLDVEVIGYD